MSRTLSMEAMSLFFNLSPDIFCIVSGDGHFMELNPAWESTLGYPIPEMIGKRFLDFVHPDDVEHTAIQTRLQIAGQETLNFLNRYRCKDGSYRWLEWRGKTMGDRQVIYAVARDVTESKLIKDLLREKDGLLQAITNSLKDAIVMLDGDGSITFWNDGSSAILGYSRDEVIGKNFHKLVLPERFMPAHKNAFPAFQESGAGAAIGKTLEVAAIHKSGMEFPIELSLSAIKLKDKWCSIGIMHDITARIRVETELRQLSRAVEQSPVSIVITDLNGNIEYANPKAIETTGYSFDELKGQNPRVLKSGETTDTDYKKLWDTISSGSQWQGIFHNKMKDGTLYWESSTISPIMNAEGKITNYIAVKDDITDRKKISDELISSESKLREANATKDKLLSIIAHDLRGPVGTLHTTLDVIDSDDFDLTENQKSNLIAQLKKASANTLGLLDNLLNWARSQSEKLSLNPEQLSVNEVVRRNVELLVPAARKKSIRISTNTGEDLHLFADMDSIDLVIRNLLSNAIKFTPNGGDITISARDAGAQIEIEIADNGVGMDKDLAENIFKSNDFHSSKGTEKEKGSGLGLVLCKDFVEKNGGEIRVESKPGIGSKFMFTLPKSGPAVDLHDNGHS